MIWYPSIPQWFQNLFPNLIWQIPESDGQTVYLTFDDGPHPEISLWVANELEKRGLKATFFCVGDNVKKYPDTHFEIIQRGHRVGNHTMNHLKGWKTENNLYFENVRTCAELVTSDLFRPPYGRIKSTQINYLKTNYRIVMWSILSYDFLQGLNCKSALKNLKHKTKNGSIVVFHDSVKAEKNLRAILPDYLDFLVQNGYTCKTL